MIYASVMLNDNGLVDILHLFEQLSEELFNIVCHEVTDT